MPEIGTTTIRSVGRAIRASRGEFQFKISSSKLMLAAPAGLIESPRARVVVQFPLAQWMSGAQHHSS